MSVFVSGATGYLAQHVVKQLIEKGYKVVGGVRSAEKGDRLKANVGDNFLYEVVKDIAEENAFDEALEKHPEATVFVHTASPLTFDVKDIEKELLLPAVNGTKNALASIKKHAPQVRKVVITSSYVAASIDTQPEEVVDETSWSGITREQAFANAQLGYIASKTYAEEAAWEFISTEKPNFTLNTILPSFIFGPQAYNSTKIENASSKIIENFLKLKPTDEVPGIRGPFIDVRDAARAHLHAFESDTANFRYLLFTSLFTGQEIADIINKNFPELEGRTVVGTPGTGHEEVVAKYAKASNAKTLEKLGKGIPLEKTTVDTVLQILSQHP